MIYSDKERLGISILLSLIIFISLFLVFDYLVEMELLRPKVIRPPLIVSFYEEKPAPQQQEIKEDLPREASVTEESQVQEGDTPRQTEAPPSPPRETETSSSTSSVNQTTTPAESSGAARGQADAAPVSWGDEPETDEPFVPEESSVEYADNSGSTAPAESAEPVPEVELVSSQYDERLSKISEKSVEEGGTTSSTADLDGTNPSPISSTSPKSLDEITDTRELKRNPLPVPPAGALHGLTELYIEVDFDVTWSGRITNLQFRNKTGYDELEQAIRTALQRWQFEAAPQDSPDIRVRTGFNFRAR